MENLFSEKEIEFEKEIAKVFSNLKIYDSNLKTSTEAIKYLSGIIALNIKDERDYCTIIGEAVIQGIIRGVTLNHIKTDREDFKETILDVIRGLTKYYAYLGQRFEIDIMPKKKK